MKTKDGLLDNEAGEKDPVLGPKSQTRCSQTVKSFLLTTVYGLLSALSVSVCEATVQLLDGAVPPFELHMFRGIGCLLLIGVYLLMKKSVDSVRSNAIKNNKSLENIHLAARDPPITFSALLTPTLHSFALLGIYTACFWLPIGNVSMVERGTTLLFAALYAHLLTNYKVGIGRLLAMFLTLTGVILIGIGAEMNSNKANTNRNLTVVLTCETHDCASSVDQSILNSTNSTSKLAIPSVLNVNQSINNLETVSSFLSVKSVAYLLVVFGGALYPLCCQLITFYEYRAVSYLTVFAATSFVLSGTLSLLFETPSIRFSIWQTFLLSVTVISTVISISLPMLIVRSANVFTLALLLSFEPVLNFTAQFTFLRSYVEASFKLTDALGIAFIVTAISIVRVIDWRDLNADKNYNGND